ncbi:MAG: hypothetical protein KFB97_06410 [Cyanobium sp. M30B3]|nr:MAG: hypothetical protein KFB97_06410 [Cyanobium sp. M30B3]
MPYSGSIQIVNDANGAAYAFLADNGLIWQCVWNAQAERWDKGQVVPGAEGGRELQALVLDDLWPTSGVSGAQQGNSPGIVLAYRVGSGSNSKVVASLAGWGSDGALGWSEAVSLSNEQGNDEAFALVNGGNGRLRVVVQKREAETSAADLLQRLQEAPSELLSKELDQLASGTRPDSDLYVSDVQINADTDGGGYALQLSGNGATSSIALSPAAASATVNQPGLPSAGMTELSRAALTAHVVTPETNKSALVGLGATPVGVAAPTAGGNSGVPGLGFTRYAQNPKSLASLALFPTRYAYSSALGRLMNSYGAIQDRAIDEYEPSEVDPSEYDRSESSSASFDDEATDRTESFANRSMLSLEADPVLIDAFEEVVKPLEVIEDLEIGGRLVTGASVKPNHAETTNLGSGLVLSGLFGGLLTGRGGYSVVNFTTLKYDSGAQSNKLSDQVSGRTIANMSAAKNPLNSQGSDLSVTNSGLGVGGSFKTLFQYSGSGFNQKLTNFTAQESVGIYGLLNHSKFRENYTLHTDASIAFSLLSEQRFSSSDGLPRALADIGLATGAAGDLLNLIQTTGGVYGASRVGLNGTSISKLSNGYLGNLNGQSSTKYLQGIGLLSTGLAVGSTVGVLASSMRNSGSFSMGVGFQEALELKLLSRYGVGVAAHLGSQQNWLWTLGDGLVKPDFQFLLFASAGVATVGGGYIPLINGSYVYNSNTQSDTSSDNGTTAALEGTANTQPTSNGLLTLAPTGADTPFGYAPTAASDALLNSNDSPWHR